MRMVLEPVNRQHTNEGNCLVAERSLMFNAEWDLLSVCIGCALKPTNDLPSHTRPLATVIWAPGSTTTSPLTPFATASRITSSPSPVQTNKCVPLKVASHSRFRLSSWGKPTVNDVLGRHAATTSSYRLRGRTFLPFPAEKGGRNVVSSSKCSTCSKHKKGKHEAPHT